MAHLRVLSTIGTRGENTTFTTEEVLDVVVTAANNASDLEPTVFFIQTLKMLWHWGMHDYFSEHVNPSPARMTSHNVLGSVLPIVSIEPHVTSSSRTKDTNDLPDWIPGL